MFDFLQLCEKEILYDCQFGVKSRHSTQQAHITLVIKSL